MNMWSNEDPRHLVKLYARIIVYDMTESWVAFVIMGGNSYDISAGLHSLDANENWPNYWLWTYAPRHGENKEK